VPTSGPTDAKKPEYLAKFPMGQIPAFEGTDGFKLTETRAVARYSEYTLLVNLLVAVGKETGGEDESKLLQLSLAKSPMSRN
jgi:hypothetical protein